MGTVVATCSGQRRPAHDDLLNDDQPENKDTEGENSLKVWSMPFLAEEDANL